MTKSLTQELQERITEFDKCRIKYKRGSDERFIFLTRIDELQKTLELVQEKIGKLITKIDLEIVEVGKYHDEHIYNIKIHNNNIKCTFCSRNLKFLNLFKKYVNEFLWR